MAFKKAMYDLATKNGNLRIRNSATLRAHELSPSMVLPGAGGGRRCPSGGTGPFLPTTANWGGALGSLFLRLAGMTPLAGGGRIPGSGKKMQAGSRVAAWRDPRG